MMIIIMYSILYVMNDYHLNRALSSYLFIINLNNYSPIYT